MANRYTVSPEAARRRIVSVRYAPDELAKVTAAARKKKIGVSEYIRQKSLDPGRAP